MLHCERQGIGKASATTTID